MTSGVWGLFIEIMAFGWIGECKGLEVKLIKL